MNEHMRRVADIEDEVRYWEYWMKSAAASLQWDSAFEFYDNVVYHKNRLAKSLNFTYHMRLE